ncbi:MAG: hypothetical protein J6K29_04290 [Clostridia bacterium]|nr:hypothetical protein [Clostridia bacterium]
MSPSAVYPRQCFAAANSREGFRSYYGNVFSDNRIDRLYIIKGGPGTGKSHFMKVVARHAREQGYTVTECFCSSDPNSLDGIILSRAGSPTAGLLDGTAPHVCEPTLPGARDELIDLGRFWDGEALGGQRDTIASLGQKKSTAYARAYTCLRAAGEMDSLADSLMEPCVDESRLTALAARLLRSVPSGETFEAVFALRRAISMTGRHTLPSYEAAAKTLILPDNGYGMGFRLMSLLLAVSEARRHRVFVSYDPLCPQKPDGLLYPETGLCILTAEATPAEGIPTRTLPLRRYTNPRALREIRGELRRTVAMRETLTDTALRHLASAASYHFELETIYAAAMDFQAKEAFTERFCRELLR